MRYRVVVMANHFPQFREVRGLTDIDFEDIASAKTAAKARFPGGRWVTPRGIAATVCDATGQVASLRLKDGTVAIHEMEAVAEV